MTRSPKARWNEDRIKDFNAKVFDFISTEKLHKKHANLTGVEFPGDIDFLLYDNNNPLPPISFSAARFGGIAKFAGTRFGSDVEFGGTRFNSIAQFIDARFSGETGFFKAQFGGHAIFDRARFYRSALFHDARFDSEAEFIGARFGGIALFTKSQFEGNADFLSEAATCSDKASDAYPPADRFPSFVKFDGAHFKKIARFANRQFLLSTDFSGAVFHQAPDFHGCTLHQDTDFAHAKFKQISGGEAARAYRTLKLAMEGLRARREEARFYGLEQKSLLFSLETGPVDKLFSALYWLLANYGQTVWLPLVWLVALQFGFAWFYPEFFPEVPAESFADTLRFSLNQVFRPFYIFREVDSGPHYSLPLLITAAGQSLATIGFVALFLLALRRRFRMG